MLCLKIFNELLTLMMIMLETVDTGANVEKANALKE